MNPIDPSIAELIKQNKSEIMGDGPGYIFIHTKNEEFAKTLINEMESKS